MRDLIDVLEIYHLPEEVVELIRDALANPEVLEEYALKNNLCPKCGEELKFCEWEEERGEYLGFPCSEKVGVKCCRDCGWKQN